MTEPPQDRTAEQRLTAAGHRLTRQRKAVLGALLRADSGVTAADVFEAARRGCPDLGLATVYRTLEMLAEVDAVRRVHGDDRCEAFVLTTGRHGHTIVCSGCGRVGEFTACDMSPVLAAAARETGFAVDGHFLQLSGTCRECAARARRPERQFAPREAS